MASRYRPGLVGYLAGSMAARTGDEASGPALVLLGLAVAASPGVAASLLAALTLTTALGGPVFGAVLDRSTRPGQVLAAALCAYAVGLAVVAVLLGRVPLVGLILLAGAVGVVGPALTAGWTSRLPALGYTGHRLRRGYAADTASYAAAALLGPALAGAVAAGPGARWSALAAAALLILAVPVALALPGGATPAPTRPLAHDLRDGIGAVLTNPRLRAASLVSALSYLGIGAATVAVPALGARLTGRPGTGAALLAVLAAGSLLATAALARWPVALRPERQVLVGTAVLGLGLAVVAFAPGVPLAIVGLVLAGLADGPQLAALLLIRHREAPERLRAQVFGTAVSIKQLGFAVGAALAGALAGGSPRAALVLAAGAQLAALAAGWPTLYRSR